MTDGVTNVGQLQKYIADQEEVWKILPAEDVREALDLLTLNGLVYTKKNRIMDRIDYVLKHSNHGN